MFLEPQILINGLPLNKWPNPQKHLRDTVEAEDVEYVELQTTTTDNDEAERYY